MTYLTVVVIVSISVAVPQVFCGLYPRDSETRFTTSLNGLWDFTLTGNGSQQKAGLNTDDGLQLMAVPASYNDITTDWNVREHVGKVYYRRKFFVPSTWKDQRVWVRFGSVCYSAKVFVNGEFVIYHEIGHLPFDGELTNIVNYGDENLIVVEVDNTLTNVTIPQGEVKTLTSGRLKQSYTYDFYNYAGIDRPVFLYTTPQIFIEDLTLITDYNNTHGLVNFTVTVNGSTKGLYTEVYILDRENNIVNQSNGSWDDFVTATIENAILWWPYQMDANPAYLYTIRVELRQTDDGTLVDVYKQAFGIRRISWNDTTLLINGRSVYLRGLSKHEDSDIRGKGLDLPLQLRDYNLLRWLGVNAYRTSHYPYADEILDLADEAGIMIIDECPAVNMDEELLENHKESLRQMIARDKNHPSVIMWSVANEARTQHEESENYFKEVFEYGRSLETTRPFTIINCQEAEVDHSGQFADILGFNVYLGWYEYIADLDAIAPILEARLKSWNNLHHKPVFISEYGAETLIGYHSLPNFVWSEEYQINFLSTHFKVFDQLRQENNWFIGEMIWNFADFKTNQDITRVGGNRKGIFTRQREPKSSAFVIRERYWNLANILDNCTTIPLDLRPYVVAAREHDEL